MQAANTTPGAGRSARTQARVRRICDGYKVDVYLLSQARASSGVCAS
jgi:hypothetical protein